MKLSFVLILSLILMTGCISDDDYFYTNSNTNGSIGCPTTAACGCSNKNKADCEADYCCKWTVGQGCGCN